jgi:hypothetical protein
MLLISTTEEVYEREEVRQDTMLQKGGREGLAEAGQMGRPGARGGYVCGAR